MKNHRLSRLTLLTQGIALIGFGMSELACAKDQPDVNGPKPDDQVHINAPPQPAASDSAVVPTTEMPHINATATPPSSASAAPSTSASTTASTTPPPQPPRLPHTNAPMRKP